MSRAIIEAALTRALADVGRLRRLAVADDGGRGMTNENTTGSPRRPPKHPALHAALLALRGDEVSRLAPADLERVGAEHGADLAGVLATLRDLAPEAAGLRAELRTCAARKRSARRGT